MGLISINTDRAIVTFRVAFIFVFPFIGFIKASGQDRRRQKVKPHLAMLNA